jgi:hypothetical protein
VNTLDPTLRLVLDGLLGQVPATLLTTAMLAGAAWLGRTVRARRARPPVGTAKSGRSIAKAGSRKRADIVRRGRRSRS